MDQFVSYRFIWQRDIYFRIKTTPDRIIQQLRRICGDYQYISLAKGVYILQ